MPLRRYMRRMWLAAHFLRLPTHRKKRENVISQLIRTAGIDEEKARSLVRDTVPSKRTMGYRNKLEFGCGRDARGGFVVGPYKKHTNEILPIDSCPLAHKGIEKAPKAIRGSASLPQRVERFGNLPHRHSSVDSHQRPRGGPVDEYRIVPTHRGGKRRFRKPSRQPASCAS